MWTVFREVFPNRSSLQSVRQINIHDFVDDVCVESSFTGTGVKGTVNMKIERFSKSSSTSGLPIVLSCLMFAVGLTGCGEAVKPWEIVVPASGKITFEGKPDEGAELTLTPVSAEVPATVRPSAKSVADGSFTLGTYGTGDGAPAGDYNVSAVWFKLVNSGGSMVRGDNALPAKYANPETSGIKIVIGDTETTIPQIDLRNK